MNRIGAKIRKEETFTKSALRYISPFDAQQEYNVISIGW